MNKVIVFREILLPSSETFIKEQVLALTDWSATVAGYSRFAKGLALDGMDIRILPGLTSGLKARLWLKLHRWLGLPHRPTVRALMGLDADLVHVHFGTDATDIWPSVKATGLPMLVTLHGYDINIRRDWWEAGHRGFRRRFYPRQLLRMAGDRRVRFVAVSKAIRERAIEFGIPENKVTVAYIGINTEYFKPRGMSIDRRSRRILFVGRMVEKKAPLLLIRAFARLRQSVHDAELVMVGAGPLLDQARKLATAFGVPVTFLEACTPAEVQAQIHQSRVLCLPSVIATDGNAEGFPLTLLEAQACGVPVVSSARGGAEEGLRHGVTGYRFPSGDVDQMAGCIMAVLEDASLAKRMSRAASLFVAQQYDIQRTTGDLEALYRRQLQASL